MTNVFLDATRCPACGSTALAVMRMRRGGPVTTTRQIKPQEIVLECGDCGRDFHARASRWMA